MKQNREDEDENINRLVQDCKDDVKSVSFGKRTNLGSNVQNVDNLKRVVPQDGPLKMAIQ